MGLPPGESDTWRKHPCIERVVSPHHAERVNVCNVLLIHHVQSV